MTSKSGIAIATAAAALFAAGVTTPATEGASAGEITYVKCAGINRCKGYSECKTATHACKGQNTCKGKGWLNVPSAEECLKKGGSIQR